MFMDAEYSFSMLKFYQGEMTTLLRGRADDFHKYSDELEEEHKKRQQPFDKEYWLKHYDVYAAYYPKLFNNSFIISACALFEFHIRKICDLAKEEHKVPYSWDDINKNRSVPFRAKSYLWHAGILLKDDPPGSFQYWLSIDMLGQKRITVQELWQELEHYFRIRNCIAHHNGFIQKMRYPDRIIKYATKRDILVDNKGQAELSLTPAFNNEVCGTMEKYFGKLASAYYSAPLPE